MLSREQLLAAIVEHADEAVNAVDQDGTIIAWNRAAERVYGYPAEEALGMPIARLLAPEARTDLEGLFARLRRGERIAEVDTIRVRKDGTRFQAAVTISPIFDEHGALVGASATVRDVTDLRCAEQSRREIQYLLEQAEALAHVGSWAANAASPHDVIWSAEAHRIFAMDEQQPVEQEDFFGRIPAEERGGVAGRIQSAIERRGGWEIEHRIVCADGQTRWVRNKGTAVGGGHGGAIRLLGVLQDITDEKRARAELEASEARYRRIVETTSDGIWAIDADSTTTFVNSQMARMFGCEPEDVVGRPNLDFVGDEFREQVRRTIQERRAGMSGEIEVRLKRKDGTPFWARVRGTPLVVDGRYDGAVAIVTDTTVQREAQRVQALLASFVETSSDAVLAKSVDGVVWSWNQSAERLYGYRADEMIGRNIASLIPSDRSGEGAHLLSRIRAGEKIDGFVTERRRKDGSLVPVALSLCPLRDAAGAIVGAAAITRDLTEQRKAEAALHRSEEQLRQAIKMEAIGRLAGGIAHDFNNLLTVILSYASLLLAGTGGDKTAELEEIRTAASRAAELTRQLLAFSRKQVLQPQVVNLNEVLVRIKGMLERILGEDIELMFRPTAALREVFADPGQIEQVIMNLAVNARDAMPEGGRLTLETSNVELTDAYAAEHLDVKPGQYVLLAITDTGTGMEEATLARIFEPFFTTKQDKGTGLGLSTVYGIVRQSGGHVGVYSELGSGTTFKVYLPRKDAGRATKRPTPGRAPDADLTGSETVLLVEDNDQVRKLVRTVLSQAGYSVIDAGGPAEAEIASEKHKGRIDLLVTDVVMPRMTGPKLAVRLATSRPEMRVLYVSGYAENAIVHGGSLDEGVEFLQKPLAPTVLLGKVREILDRR